MTFQCLVVDDHEEGAEALGAFLTTLGADVRVALSGWDAIDIAPALRPRLVGTRTASAALDTPAKPTVLAEAGHSDPPRKSLPGMPR